MEEIMLSKEDHYILKKNKQKLEAHFAVAIKLPEITENMFCSKDIIVASVFGASKNRSYVTKFLEKKRKKVMLARKAVTSSNGNIPVIVLSESDSENAVLAETQNKRKRKRQLSVKERDEKYRQSVANFCPTTGENDSNCHVVSNCREPEFKEQSFSSTVENQCVADFPNISTTEKDDSIIVLSENINSQPMHHLVDRAKELPIKGSSTGMEDTPVTDDSIVILSEDTQVQSHIHAPSSSCQGTDVPVKSVSEKADDSIVILSDYTALPAAPEFIALPAAPEFIPLRTSRYAAKKEKKRSRFDSGGTLSCEVLIPNPNEKRVLRPIVIDGSNVAREHGKVHNIFSCKGIKIAIDYFLKRGHTQVTALLPHFRKHCNQISYPTTDQHLLKELEKSQRVVFTPSRRMYNGKTIACYDDRFIVNLASQTEGVIVSNDNYRDIIGESPQFKKTVEERLLMYCFVGDIIMIPEDPLGRYGPKLDTFLSMKEPVNEETQPNSSQVNNQQQQFLNLFFGNINAPTA